MKKIGLGTTFYKLDNSYSLTSVVLQQAEILYRFGYQPVLFVLTNFEGEVPDYIELRKVIPQWILEPYQTGHPIPDDFENNVAETTKVFEKEFADLSCLIVHDWCFINSYLIYNVALKKAALGNLPILHQIHSGPSTRLMQLGYPWDELWKLPMNAKLIYMNNTEMVAAGEHYGIWPKDVRVVYNPMDLRFILNLSPLTRELIEAYDLFKADVIMVYPISSTRMGDDGKAVRKVISIAANLKKLGQEVRLIIPNAHANGEKEKKAILDFQMRAASQNLSINEVIFTSFHKAPEHESGLPHEIVRELFQISDLFIFPSYSENAPLILLEAAATKNLLVLNEDFEPMTEFLGPEASFQFGFTSRRHQQREYPNGEEAYYDDVAKIIMSDLGTNRISISFRKVRKYFNWESIGRNQLIPAIEGVIYDLQRK